MNRLSVLLGVCLLLAACNKRGEGEPAKLPPPDSPAPGVPQVGLPVTEEEARQYGAALENAIMGGDAKGAEDLLRSEDLVSRMVSDLGLTEEERKEAEAGAAASLKNNNFGLMLIQTTANGGSCKFLRAHSAAGKLQALFRFISNDGRFGYHDIILARSRDGQVRMEDVYVFATGELFSQSMRRLIIPTVAKIKKNGAPKGNFEDDLSDYLAINEVTKATSQGNMELAHAKYESLPKRSQENKTVLLIYLLGAIKAREAGVEYFAPAMKRFRSLYPKDACIDFLSLGYHQLRNEVDLAIEAIDRIDAAVGGDSYLDTLKTDLLIKARRFDDARISIDKAIKENPALSDAYWWRITLSIREKKFGDTLEWLKKVVQNCNEEVAGLDTTPEFADFVKSPQYREWLEWYRTHKKK